MTDAEPLTPADDSAPTTGSSAALSAADPVLRAMLVAIIGVIILFLVAIISAMVFGYIGTPKAPRTAVERELNVLSAKVETGKADVKTWANYVKALTAAGQYSKAQAALDKSLKAAKSDKSFLLVEQARLDLATERYSESAKSADKAIAEAERELQKRLEEVAKKNVKADLEKERPLSWGEAALIKAEALGRTEDIDAAIKAYDAYLVLMPTASDMFVERGQLKAKNGDKAGAEKDFREALRFVPDSQPALDGLKQIGAEAK